jgi:hypothetical protein
VTSGEWRERHGMPAVAAALVANCG